jgi:hypothetical protein
LVQSFTPAPPVLPQRSDLGYLVYAADDATGHAHLWIWNLSASTVTTGPAVPAIPTELLFSYAITSGWVGLTTPTSSGELRASALRDLDPGARPITIATGELITWLSSGGYVTSVDASSFGGCHHAVRVVTSYVARESQERSLNEDVCGVPTSVGRNLTFPYLTIERGGRPSIYVVNNRELEPVLHGYGALSVSLNGDLLVQRPEARELAYYYPSPTGDAPARIGRPGQPLLAERVLGWDGDASNAFVLGSMAGVRGVYRIAVSPRVKLRSPVLVLQTEALDVSASPTPLGDVYISTDGGVTLVRESEEDALQRPAGTPVPVGPLLWISTLPYSPSVAG